MTANTSEPDIFSHLWATYVKLNPNAEKIKALFEQKGEVVINDHIAFRTYSADPLGVAPLSDSFLKLGYQEAGEYLFPSKHLLAKHFEAPGKKWPKIFISELDVTALSQSSQDIIRGLIVHLDPKLVDEASFCYSGRPWPAPSFHVYEQLRAESEYAAWMAVFGHVPNHFTIRVNELKHFRDLNSVNAFVEKAGYALNESGGKIKGSPESCLEQSSTLADKIEVQFSDGAHVIPSVFYEFALRYPRGGKLFEGFVTDNAEKIFESTDQRK